MRLGLLAAAWLAGTYIGLNTDAPTLALIALLLAVLCGGLLLRIHRLSWWPMVLAAVLLLAALRVAAADDSLPPLAQEDEQQVTLRGMISDDPEASAQSVKFTFSVEAIDRGGGMEPVEATVLAYAPPPAALAAAREPPYFRYKDALLLEGQLQRPKRLADFDYPSYLASHGISGVVFARSSTVLEPGTATKGGWRGWIFDLRRELSENIDDALPVPHSAVAKALLLGQREQLPDSLVQDFRDTGTSHVLAISGLHVGVLMVIAVGAAAAAIGRHRGAYLIAPLLLIWIYVLMSGLPPSALRAAIMGTVYITALALGRPRSLLPALALSAAAMTAFEPRAIAQVSFQLSFAAMAGIALAIPHFGIFSPAIARMTSNLPFWTTPWLAPVLNWIATAFIVSIAATLATWPLVAFNFDRIPVFGIFVTILVLPALPFVLLGALAAAMAGLLHPAVGQFFGWMAWAPLSYLIEVVARAPGYTVSGAWVGGGLVWAWYLVLGGILLRAGSGFRLPQMFPVPDLRKEDQESTQSSFWGQPTGRSLSLAFLTPMLAVAAVFLWMQLFDGPDGKLQVYFFDVGQGDSTLIVTPKGRQILVDGGPDAESATRALADVMPESDRSLDMVALTHLDADHSRGLLRVLDHYSVAAVLVGVEDRNSSLYSQWRSQLDRGGPREIPVRAGHRIVLEPSLTLDVLNPPEIPIGGSDADQNNNSVVLRLVYDETSILLTGDIAAEAEGYLVRNSPELNSTVLKVAHHGSRSSTTSTFLGTVDPALAVVSAGADNRYGHPHREVEERLLQTVGDDLLYRTDHHGTVELISDGESLWVRTER